MSPEERKAARARCEAATGGPWYTSADHPGTQWAGEFFVSASEPVAWDEDMDDEPVHGVLKTVNELSSAEANAAFCAYARTDLPAALDEIDRLEQQAVRWEAMYEGLPVLLVDLWGAGTFKNHLEPGLAERFTQKMEQAAALAALDAKGEE